MKTRRMLLDRFPDNIQLWYDFGVSALIQGRNEDARKVFQGVRARAGVYPRGTCQGGGCTQGVRARARGVCPRGTFQVGGYTQ